MSFYDSILEKGLLKEKDKQPEVSPFRMYVDAFYELSTCRISGLALGPIPFTAIMEYSRLFDVGDFSEFHYCIRAMDNELLRLETEKSKKSQNTSKQGKK